MLTDARKRFDASQKVLYPSETLRSGAGKGEFIRGSRHVKGIESFWSYAKHRLAQFHGVRRDKFELPLKETASRFNRRHLDLYKTLLTLFRDEPL